jgi:choline-sulfatase
MSGPTPEFSTAPAQEDTAIRGLGVAAARVFAVGFGLLVLEIVARLTFDVAFPHGRDLLWDTLARLGRLGALAGTAWLLLAGVSLASRRSAGVRGAVVGFSRLRDHLCAGRPAMRMVALFAVATLAITPAAARRYQLAWRAAAVFACGVLACGVAAELVLAWRRARSSGWASPSWTGRALWMAHAAFLGILVFPRIAGFGAAVVGTALVVLAVTPAVRLPRAVLAIFAIAAVAGIAVDERLPALRRFASAHAPYSALGLGWMRRLTDFDGDGSSGVLGLDCDNWDAARQPKGQDLPGNGIDEDCSGADARIVPQPGVTFGASSVASHPDVFLITIDALRADALMGMPRIRRWASHCISFDHARSASNFTSLSLSALLTGTEPRYLRSDYRIAIVPPLERSDPRSQSSPPTLATLLRQAGYFGTAVVPFQPPLLYLFHGFEDVRVPPRQRVSTPAREVLAQVQASLDRRLPDRPFLLWAHFLDTHAPYLGGTSRADYRRAAALLDDQLGSFLESLPRSSLVVLTADHGEAFGEHGKFTHEETMFEEELRVPLVLCAPPSAGLGEARVSSALVSTLDIMPTIVELAVGARVEPLGGKTLVPYLRDGAPEPHAFLRFEGWLPDHHTQAVASGCYKWMRDLDDEWQALFDLCRDPGERDDRTADAGEVARSMRKLLFESEDAYPAWLQQAAVLLRQGQP